VEETCEISDLKVASIEMKKESVQSSNSSNEIPDLELDMLEMENSVEISEFETVEQEMI